MKKTSLIFFAFSALLFTVSCEKKNNENQTAQTDTTTSMEQPAQEPKGLSDDDKDFMKKAAQDGMLEVQLGKIGEKRAMSKEVKNFGKMLEKEHSEADTKLKELAASKNVMLPDSLNNDQKDKVKKFETEVKAKDFDSKYIKSMIDDHKQDIQKFEDRAQNTQDTDLKAWIENTLPHLKHHLAEAQRIDSMLNTSTMKAPISKK